MPIINNEFIRAYTLGRYRQWRDERDYGVHEGEEVGRMLVESARVLAGQDVPNGGIVRQMVGLILKPGVSFWGVNTNASLGDVVGACEDIVEQEIVEGLSQTSLG